MTQFIPQIILIILLIIEFSLMVHAHNKSKMGRNNRRDSIIAIIIELPILIFGDFFSDFSYPQWIYIITRIGILIRAFYIHEDLRKGKHSIFTYLFLITLNIMLFYWGGFFDILFTHIK